MNVALVGASADPSKYAHMALVRLESAGHRVFPVNPKLGDLEGRKVYASLSALPEPVDTVTLYVSKRVSDAVAEDILSAKPRRIIFNPGAENPELAAEAARRGIRTLDACTLVMLSTDQFGK